MSYLKGFAFVLVFFIVASLTAQPSVIDEREYSITETFVGDKDNSPLREYFVAISKSEGRLLSSLQISFSYLLHQKIVAFDSAHFAVISELKQLRTEGDKFYRLLDASEAIIPDEYYAKIILSRCIWEQGNLKKIPLDTFDILQDPLINRMGYFSLDTLFFTDSIYNVKYELEWVNHRFGFSDSVVQAFNQFSSLCDSYYAEIPKIIELSKKIEQIDVDSVDFVQFSNIELKEVEGEIAKIDNENYPMKLNLFRFDPAQFLSELNNLKLKTEKKRFTLNTLLQAVDVLFYDKGMHYFINNDFEKATKYFEKSLALNPYFAASQFRLSEICYRKGLIDSSSVLLIKMSEMNFTSALLQSEAQSFCKTVYNELLNEGKRLNGRGEYYEAIGKLENAKVLCETYKNDFCSEMGLRMLSESYYGLYESFLTIATKAINNSRFEIAETYIEQSFQYQKEHSAYIISNNSSFELLKTLSAAYNNEIVLLIKKNRFEAALDKLKRLESLNQKYEGRILGTTLELKEKIQQGVYNERIDKAIFWIEKKNFASAESELLQSKEFMKTNHLILDTSRWFGIWVQVKQHEYTEIAELLWKKFKKNPSSRDDYSRFIMPARILEISLPLKRWDSLLYYALPYAKEDLVQMYETAKLFIGKGDSINAFSQKHKAEEEARLWGLESWDTLSLLKKEFEILDFSRRCEKHQIHHQLMLTEAKSKIQSQLFSEALTILENIKNETLKNIECGIDDKEVFQLIQEIIPATQYSELMEKSKLAGNNGLFSMCINSYIEAENLYKRSEISKFGAPIPDPKSFFSMITDETIIYRAVDYFIECRRFSDALNVLIILKKRGFSATLTKDLQERLGQKLAVRDKLENPTLNYRVEVLKYSDGEEYFRTLVKNYFKTWKKISR